MELMSPTDSMFLLGESRYGAWTYQDGEVTKLLEPGGTKGDLTISNDINDDGTVVGSYVVLDDDGGDIPAKWEPGATKATVLDTGDAEWGEVTAWEPPRRLCYLFHIMTERANATDVEILFSELASNATKVEIIHTQATIF